MAFGPESSSTQGSASHFTEYDGNLPTIAEIDLTRHDIALLGALLQAVTLPEGVWGGVVDLKCQSQTLHWGCRW